MNQHQNHIASSGVEALIERLRDEGVSAGQEKAEAIVINAQKRADWIVAEAKLEAKTLLEKTHAEVTAIKTAADDAMQLAARDALLKLRDTLLGSFSQEVMRLVNQELEDEDFIGQLILALAGNVREKVGLDDSETLIIQLPEDVIGIEELKQNPEELKDGILSRYTAHIAANLLRQGVHFEVSDDVTGGLMVKLEDEQMVIDFSEQTIAALLLEHIQPRFRALLQGIVK
ncbi:MAG: hypothetical protein GQ569_12585 [Methylococcaceae bacterium]|nr:hypothetical protein [Methylococcaceae bacterium]